MKLITLSRGLLLGMIAAIAATVAACHHEDAAVVQHEHEAVPLPPASGTPIGYLIDASSELALRDDQLARLHVIDDELARDPGATHTQAAAPAPSEDSPSPMPGGRRGHGRHRGGRGGHARAASVAG